MIRVGSAGKMGRGVFATDFIPAYTEIARCNTITLSKDDIAGLSNTSISGHYFHEKKDKGVFVLGLITLLNHSKKPNVEVFMQNTKLGYIAICQSISQIDVTEQLFIDYGDDIEF